MRPAIICFLVLLALYDVRGVRILGLFPHTGRSHYMVFEPLLQTLAERGHDVTVASFFPRKNPLANFTDISFQGIAEVLLENFDLNAYENLNLLLRMPYVGNIMKLAMDFSMMADLALEICEKLVDWPPLTNALKKEYDLVLVENFNSDCMLGLLHVHNVQAPVVALLSSSLMPWSANRIGLNDNPSHVPRMCLPHSTQMTFTERIANTFFHYYTHYWFIYEIQMKEQALIEKQYGMKIPDLTELGKNMSLVLVNTYHVLQGVNPLVPALVEVGGMHLDPERKPIPHYIERFLNESQHGVILFSFGSTIQTSTMPKYREEIFIKVLSKLKQRVIWKYENSGDEGTLIGNGNILRVSWLPQYELLQHRQVIAFITHGGLLGTTEAVSAGKPMLVVPFYGDQPTNGAAAAAAGFAKVVPYIEISEQTLEEALQSVLSAEMRDKSRLLSKIWHDRPSSPLATAVYWVERVARWGHDAPLHSVARDLPFYQYALLDVFAVFIGAILLVVVGVWLVLLKIIRLFNKSAKQKTH